MDRQKAALVIVGIPLRQRLMAVWQLTDRRPLFMVRLSLAGEASVRSLRRPAEDLILRPSPTRT